MDICDDCMSIKWLCKPRVRAQLTLGSIPFSIKLLPVRNFNHCDFTWPMNQQKNIYRKTVVLQHIHLEPGHAKNHPVQTQERPNQNQIMSSAGLGKMATARVCVLLEPCPGSVGGILMEQQLRPCYFSFISLLGGLLFSGSKTKSPVRPSSMPPFFYSSSIWCYWKLFKFDFQITQWI